MLNYDDYTHVKPKDCVICGEPIPLARLDVLPMTLFCVDCSKTNSPKVVHDPNVLCAKPSLSCQNGFASNE